MGAPLMTVPRLVLDTNTVLSALLFSKGRLAWLRPAWQVKRFVPLVSRATTEELIRVLAYPKFKLSASERQDFLGDYLPFCETFDVPKSANLPTCRDAADIPFLALALATKADALVSGDADLLALANSFPIAIIPPGEIAARFPHLAITL
jgi:putative PIN family toxin of toxin-antitoxin system